MTLIVRKIGYVILAKAVNSINNTEIENMKKQLENNSDWWTGVVENARIERGIVQLKDGELVHFAFISHHLTTDQKSYSIFKTKDYTKYVTGYFCCEVEFGSMDQPANLKAFDKILNEIDGQSP